MTTNTSTSPIPDDAQLEQLYDGCAFAEGGCYDEHGDFYFSDCPNNRILVYHSATGETEVWHQPSLRANGMGFDRDGRLIVCCDGKDGGAAAVRRYATVLEALPPRHHRPRS